MAGRTGGSVLTSDTQSSRVCVSDVYTGRLTMRDAAINLRAKTEQRDLIDQAAAMLGKNRSDFMLEAACDRAQSILLDQVFFKLDAGRFKTFLQRLDAPSATNEGLARLMDVQAPWAAATENKKRRTR